jgi:hypothetical protein
MAARTKLVKIGTGHAWHILTTRSSTTLCGEPKGNVSWIAREHAGVTPSCNWCVNAHRELLAATLAGRLGPVTL